MVSAKTITLFLFAACSAVIANPVAQSDAQPATGADTKKPGQIQCIRAPCPGPIPGCNPHKCDWQWSSCAKKWWGGCWNECKESKPHFEKPKCLPGPECRKCQWWTDECGQKYGGCWESCKGPAPLWKKPHCEPCQKCEYFKDACGEYYGGCWDRCKQPKPQWKTPTCNCLVAPCGPTPVKCPTQSKYVQKVNNCGKKYGGWYCPAFGEPKWEVPPCGGTEECPKGTPKICVDKVNQCGKKYGGCYCTAFGEPKWEVPPCDDCPQICVDLVDECGRMYGGCYPSCKPLPVFQKPTPPCPAKKSE